MSASGQGSIISSPKPASSGIPFPANSADQGLSVDPISGAIVFGEKNNDPPTGLFQSNREVHCNNFGMFFRECQFMALNDPSATRYFSIGFGNEPILASQGDLANVIAMRTNVPTVNGLTEIGRDQSYSGIIIRNGNTATQNINFQVWDSQRLSVSADVTGNTRFFDIDIAAGHYQFGDIDSQSGGTFIDLDDNAQNISLIGAGGIKTTNPGSGQGAWLLGKVIAGASVLDATKFIEVMIDGAVVKLAVAV